MNSVSDNIHKSLSSGEASKHNRNIRRTISASGLGDIRVAGEGSYSESRNIPRGVSEQPFSCGKEEWGEASGDKSEKAQYVYPLRELQNGRLRLKIEAQVVRQPLRVSLLLFWFRASSKIFYQITKNPNCFFETNKHSNNFLSGRYVADGENLTGNYNSKGYIDFSVAKFRVCHKSEKVNLTFSEAIEISEVTDKYRRYDIVSLRRKTDLFNSTMSGGLL